MPSSPPLVMTITMDWMQATPCRVSVDSGPPWNHMTQHVIKLLFQKCSSSRTTRSHNGCLLYQLQPHNSQQRTLPMSIESPRSYTTYELASQKISRLLYAATVGPKSLYEDVHASTGHPGYVGMRWHQRNTISANYTDKDAASTRGICQGCALGSAHQYPTNQHYVLSNIPYDPGQ